MSSVTLSTQPVANEDFDHDRQRELARREMAKRSFCTLATTSSEFRSHVAGVLYVKIGGSLYISMFGDSVKARNLRQNSRVAVCIPGRKFPFYPPFAVQFQGTAELLARDDRRILDLFNAGRLKGITSANDLEDPRTIFARVIPHRRVSTYGIGVSLLQIAREPTSAVRSVTWPD